MKNVVFTKPGCGFSRAAVELLNELGVAFEERLVSEVAERQRLKDEHGWKSFPIIILNGRLIGGYTDVKKLVEQGKLSEILGG